MNPPIRTADQFRTAFGNVGGAWNVLANHATDSTAWIVWGNRCDRWRAEMYADRLARTGVAVRVVKAD